MTNLSKTRLVSVAAVAALLAACSGNSQSGLSPSQSIPASQHGAQSSQHAIPSPVARGGSVLVSKPSHVKSWIRPDVSGKALLYVSNGSNGTVEIYKYKYGKKQVLIGTLTGFSFPGAPCTDNAGNVFIPDYGAQNVKEYAYGSSTPSQTLNPNGSAISCSVDPNTNNLAVVNYQTSAGSGDIAVFANETGTPTSYTGANLYYPEFAGYDNNSNLWISGRDVSVVFNMGELPSGSSTIATANIVGATLYFPAQVQWGGTYLLVGDQEFGDQAESGVYQMSISGSTLTVSGSFVFSGAEDVLGFYKRGSVPTASIAAPDYGLGEVNVYRFPTGGTLSTFSSPESYGAVIAQKGV